MRQGTILAGLMLLCAGLTACAGTGGGQQTVQEEQTAQQVTVPASHVVLTVAARSGSHTDVINSVKADFEQSHNCTVEVLGMEADELAELVCEDAEREYGSYDLVMIDDPLMPQYMEDGVLYNLTAAGYIDDPDFVDKSLALGKDPYALGPTYALPFTGNVQLLFYNEERVGGGADISTWQGVLAAARAAQEAGYHGYCVRGQSGNPVVSDFLPILWAYGGDIFDGNDQVIIYSKESIAALSFYLELLETGVNQDKDTIIKEVQGGEAAFALGWPSWFISGDGASASYEQIPSKMVGTSEALPTGEIGNWMMGVTANTTQPALAMELLIYLTSREVQRKAIDAGGIPTRTSIFVDPMVEVKHPYLEVIHAGTINSRVRPRTSKWAQIEEVFGAELSACIEGKKTAVDALQAAQDAVEALME